MKQNDHLDKGRRLERSQQKLNPNDDWEAIVEIIYNAAIQYIAYYCELNIYVHRDSHKGLPKFLDNNNSLRLLSYSENWIFFESVDGMVGKVMEIP